MSFLTSLRDSEGASENELSLISIQNKVSFLYDQKILSIYMGIDPDVAVEGGCDCLRSILDLLAYP
jgi:hypothetical protein